MQLNLIHLAVFIAFQLVIIGTCVGATVAAYRKSKQEPAADWAAALRMSISKDIEAFQSRIRVIPELEQRITDLEQQEKRHFMSLSKQIRDLIDDDDDGASTMRELMEPYLRMAAMQQAQQRPPQPEQVAPINNGADIPESPQLPGLLENGD